MHPGDQRGSSSSRGNSREHTTGRQEEHQRQETTESQPTTPMINPQPYHHMQNTPPRNLQEFLLYPPPIPVPFSVHPPMLITEKPLVLIPMEPPMMVPMHPATPPACHPLVWREELVQTPTPPPKLVQMHDKTQPLSMVPTTCKMEPVMQTPTQPPTPVIMHLQLQPTMYTPDMSVDVEAEAHNGFLGYFPHPVHIPVYNHLMADQIPENIEHYRTYPISATLYSYHVPNGGDRTHGDGSLPLDVTPPSEEESDYVDEEWKYYYWDQHEMEDDGENPTTSEVSGSRETPSSYQKTADLAQSQAASQDAQLSEEAGSPVATCHIKTQLDSEPSEVAQAWNASDEASVVAATGRTPIGEVPAMEVPAETTEARENSATVIPAEFIPATQATARDVPSKDTPKSSSHHESTGQKKSSQPTPSAKVPDSEKMSPFHHETSRRFDRQQELREASVNSVNAPTRTPIPQSTTPQASSKKEQLRKALHSRINKPEPVATGFEPHMFNKPSQEAFPREVATHLEEPDFKALNLDALFVGDEPVDLPEFGLVTRDDYEKNKERYFEALFQHQKVVSDIIRQKKTLTRPADEEFRVVSKQKSFKQQQLTEKQHEALQSAKKESRKAEYAAQQEALVHAVGRIDLDKGATSGEPRSSTSLQPASFVSGEETTSKTRNRTKSKGKNKRKNVVMQDDDDEVFEQAAKFNMGVMLDAYYADRLAILSSNSVPADYSDEPDYYTFEKILIGNARNFSIPLGEAESKMKESFCKIVMDHLFTMELTEEVTEARRQKLIRFFDFLWTRHDDILAIDCATMEQAILNSEEDAPHIFWMYYVLCNHHGLSLHPSDGQQTEYVHSGDRTSNANTSSEPQADEEEESSENDDSKYNTAWQKITNTLENYLEMRHKMKRTKFVPPDEDDECAQYKLEKLLITHSNESPEDPSDESVKRMKVLFSLVLKMLPTWNMLEDRKRTLEAFYSHLADQADTIIIADCQVLHEEMREDNANIPLLFWMYFKLCMQRKISL